ncbi:MAG TPA: DUF2240 family protein [archaeon]|nr:DUF2240 family protein [archaeon]
MLFEDILKQIITKSGLSQEDVSKKIDEKREELSGSISKEGAAFIVAREFGIDMRKKNPPPNGASIKDVIPGLKNVSLKARILRLSDAKEFEKDGKKSKVANIVLGDSTGMLRMSLWGEQTDLLKEMRADSVVSVSGAYSKDDGRGGIEIRLSREGKIVTIEDSAMPALDKIPMPPSQRYYISDLNEGVNGEVRAPLVQVFESENFFEFCPQCNVRLKRGREGFACPTHGNVKPRYLVMVSGVIDDGTGNIRAVFFGDAALQLVGMNLDQALEHYEDLMEKVDILGREFIIEGRVRRNKMFDRLEFIANRVSQVDVQREIEKEINALETKV